MTAMVAAAVLMAAAIHAQTPDVVLVDGLTEVVVADNGAYTCHEKRAYKIVNERGAAYASMVLTLGGTSKLTDFSAACSDAEGRIVRQWKKSDLRSTQLSKELASDATTFYMEYTPRQFPVIMAFDITTKHTDGCLTYPVFCPQRGYGMEVAHAVFQISVPKRLGCRVRCENTEVQVITSDDGGGREVKRVEMNHLPPIEKEPLMPEWEETAPAVYFAPTQFTFANPSGSMATWQSLGMWLFDLQSDRRSLPEPLKNTLHQMTDTCTSVRSKVECVYRYLAQTTRYVSIQFGIGGLQPFAAADVYRTGFGDCKALSNYMVAMLNEVGVPAEYVVVSTENRHVSPDYACTALFNHVIAMVPQPADTLWIECTHPQLPLGYVHESIAGHDALAVTEKGGHLVTLPEYPDTLHLRDTRLNINVETDGSASLTVHQRVFFNMYENSMSLLRMSDAEQREALARLFYIPQLTIAEKEIIDHAAEGKAEMEVKCLARSSSWASVTGQRLFLSLSPLRQPFGEVEYTEKRRHDVCIYDGFRDRMVMEIQLPDNYEVESMPVPMNIDSPYGTSQFTVSLAGRVLHVCHTLTVKKGRHSSSSWGEFSAFLKTSVIPYSQKVVLRKVK